jgi:hypothetical protein
LGIITCYLWNPGVYESFILGTQKNWRLDGYGVLRVGLLEKEKYVVSRMDGFHMLQVWIGWVASEAVTSVNIPAGVVGTAQEFLCC